ncbi:hypothetical protein [Fusibacter sp. JL216-2]|uniref:hypothetical protein n=1 Tax=Fusibacter sp. JL216-2 TaxID=3071453 RepID=UPI003D342318
MKYVLSSLLAILGIVDLVFFVQYFESPAITSLYWQVHIVVTVASIILVRRIPRRYMIYPYFIFMILPGFGPLAFGFTQFSVIYFEYNQTLLFEYEKYVFYERILDLESQTSFSSDVKTMSIQDQFLYSQHDTKKDMISAMLSGRDSDYSYLLKDSLDDADIEVTHYAATALNAFENEFEDKISQTRNEYLSNQSPQNLMAYIDATEKYLESKLMDIEVERIIREDYIKLLYKQLEFEPDSKKIYSKIMNSYTKLEYDEKLLTVLKKYTRLYPKDPNGHLYIMNYLYRNNRLHKLAHYANHLNKRFDILPANLMPYVVFWTKEGGIS